MKQTVITTLIVVLLIGCSPAPETPGIKVTEPEVAPTEEVIPTEVPTSLPTDTPVHTETPIPPTPTTPPKKEITDASEEYLPGYLDVLSVNYYLMGETLVAELILRDLPKTLTFNRPHVKLNSMEYKWDILIDVDDDLSTGTQIFGQEGAEYSISAAYFIFEKADPVEARIDEEIQVNVGEHKPDSPGWSFFDHGEITVDPEQKSIILKGEIPGINPESRIMFQTNENHPELGFLTDQLNQ